MSAPSPTLLPSISPAEMQVLVSRAGLTLNPGQMADLVLAWRQVAGLIASIPHDRPLVDDQAYVFKLPPPKPTPPVPAAKPMKSEPKRATARKAAPKQANPPKRAKPAARKSPAKRKPPAKRKR
jgi:hypothetical protein